MLIPDASESAAVIEVRASDRAGLLYGLGAAITDCGLSIRSAHVNTLAGQAIDTFYLTDPYGSRPTQAQTQAALTALLGAARSSAVVADR